MLVTYWNTLVFRVWWSLRLTPFGGCQSSKSVKQILKSPRHNTKYTSKEARRHHACLAFNITWCQLAYHNQGWKYFAVRKDQVAIQPVTVIHNFLLIHIGEVKYCHQVLILLWTKITWALTRNWHNPNQTLSLKPKLAITDITKLKVSLKVGMPICHITDIWSRRTFWAYFLYLYPPRNSMDPVFKVTGLNLDCLPMLNIS